MIHYLLIIRYILNKQHLYKLKIKIKNIYINLKKYFLFKNFKFFAKNNNKNTNFIIIYKLWGNTS